MPGSLRQAYNITYVIAVIYLPVRRLVLDRIMQYPSDRGMEGGRHP